MLEISSSSAILCRWALWNVPFLFRPPPPVDISRYLPPLFFVETLKKKSFPPPQFFLFPLEIDSHQLAAEDSLPYWGKE